jgi:hypothetical protein
MKRLIAFLLVFFFACSSPRHVRVDQYHHKQLREAKIVFYFGKRRDTKRDTVTVAYWDYLVFYLDAVTTKDNTVICEGYDRLKILYDRPIDYRSR